MVQGSILSPIPPILYILYIYYYSPSFLPPHKGISIHLFTFSLAFILCLVWCEDRWVYLCSSSLFSFFLFSSLFSNMRIIRIYVHSSIQPILFDSVLLLVWGGIVYLFMPFSFESMYRLVWGGIGISTYLPEPTPYLGQGYTIWYKYHTVSQLNKIRILFNSPSLYTHIYPYTSVYHCIPCIHSTVYPLHLPLRPDHHTMHKRIQARIRTSVYAAPTHKRRSADAPCQAKPEKVRIWGDPLRSIYGIKPIFFIQSSQKNRLHNS